MQYSLQQIDNHFLLARGGGGGSSSGGGHSSGGGFSSGSSHSSSSSYYGGSSSSGTSASGWGLVWIIFLSFGVPIIIIILIIWMSKSSSKQGGMSAVPAGFIDPNKDKNVSEEEKKLAKTANKIFIDFQKAWANFDLKLMKQVTSAEYYKKMVLELNVLQNYKRQNLMDDVVILGTYLGKSDDYANGFSIFFQAKAQDKLIDTSQDNQIIFTDSNPFSEVWTFVKSGSSYVLDKIDETTADVNKIDANIASFASSNGFYYDPDFGWLMMPSRGAIFGPQGFGNADINNHVIGYYGKGQKAKIVEFYSYEPKAGAGLQPITVAQAILPKRYDDILVTEKSWYNFKPKMKGLNKVETESVEFNKKFAVWAANQDQATSFELLATNFMERIYALNFEVNIEVVDNVLYLYSPGTNINYADMLEVLSWAFDEMKM